MEKQLKDYLHLYLGCECKTSEGTGILIKVGDPQSGEDCEISIENDDIESGFYGEWTDYNFEHHKIKPILRPLSSITEEEETQVCKLCFGNDDFIITYRGMGYTHDVHHYHESIRCLKLETYCEHPSINNWIPAALVQLDFEDKCQPIIIGRFGDIGKMLKDDLIEEPFELTRYLLSKHFDLFNLIESGLAIDATTLQKEVRP